MRRHAAVIAAVAVCAGAAVAGVHAVTDTDPPRAQCQVRHVATGVLPDPSCTPGKALPGVTEAEVCTPGWAAQHRDVPASVRRQVLASYGDPAKPYEVDHLISLELGGTNDPANLWPEPGPIPNPKDAVENRLHRLVCSGRLDLADAQKQVAADWTAVPGA